MISKYVINNSFFSVGKTSLKGGGKRGKIGVIPSVRTAQRKTFLTFEHKGTRIFLITKGCSKKKMLHPIFLNNGVGLRDESATFLHNFSSLYLQIIRKWLTICVFAGLTRNLILSSSNATRCVPTPLIRCSAGSRPARKMRKNTPIVPRRLLNESEAFC